MRILLLLLISTVLFVSAGCDGGTNPLTPERDTIYVVDTTGNGLLTRLYKGQIDLYDNCEKLANAGGVTVRMHATGETVMTDDSGRFTIHAPLDASSIATFSKEGFYTTVDAAYSYDAWKDQLNKRELRLNKYSRFTAKFTDTIKYTPQLFPVYKDTMYVDTNGVWVRDYRIVDTTVMYEYRFEMMLYNEKGEQTSLGYTSLLFSTQPDIDPTDTSTYKYKVQSISGSPYPFRGYVRAGELESRLNLRPDQDVYVTAVGVGSCDYNNLGRIRSEVLKLPRP